ncbi:G-patch domain-containing protein [Moelleriella libera RCEF 2490]|uniref:G-patch domain-containing protein n=1 Tax=Moelleriella libera RCEF 2490 TaxID=1081109 RepID=A0A168EWL1_9HYPO|nr:G-patch domain-containing protein [Moelleriella libera RCEF 2490]
MVTFSDDDEAYSEFGPRKKRRVGTNQKERAALGIFGSDSEDDAPHSQWKRKTLRTKGMAFVTSNAKSSDTEDEPDNDDDHRDPGRNGDLDPLGEDDNGAREDEDDRILGIGLGFTSGSNFRNGEADSSNERKSTTPSKMTSRFHENSRLQTAFVPSVASEPVLRESLSTQDAPQNKPQPSSFTSKGKMNAKGFGARMMAKMGYREGKGLGKEGQGRNIIIEANLRPQGVGLGAVKEKSEQERKEEKRQAELRGEKIVESDEEDQKRRRTRTKGLGGSTPNSTTRRQKTRYLTAEELKASAPGLHIPEAFAPILDMTRPGEHMITSRSGIMTPSSGKSEISDDVDARKLANRARADLLAFSEEWRSLQEQGAWMDLELEEREREAQNLQSDVDRYQALVGVITQEVTKASDLDHVVACLDKIIESGASNGDMAELAVAAIHPILEKADWKPLEEPRRFTPELTRLSGLLMASRNDNRALDKSHLSGESNRGIYRQHAVVTTPYDSMMFKFWFRKAVGAAGSWDALTPSPMLDLVEAWKDLLPPFVWAQVMGVVVRKLGEAVESWEPKKRKQTPFLAHTWLFPWLPHLPTPQLDPLGTGLIADVKRKFRQLMDIWEFERGIIPSMAQWQIVFGNQWQPMIMSHLLPAMGRYLRQNFRVDPADQEPYLPILNGVMEWRPILGEQMIGEVLVQHVFPMWHAKLRQWWALPDVDFSEVADWYEWWRDVVLKDVRTEGVMKELDGAIWFMNERT